MASEQFLDFIQKAEAEACDRLATAETKAVEIQIAAAQRADAVIADARLRADEERQITLSQAEESYRSMLQELETERHTPVTPLSPEVREKAVNAVTGRIVNLFGNS